MTNASPVLDPASRFTRSARSILRAEDYLSLAKQAALSAEGSSLPHVRLKHELAARTWLELAGEEVRPSANPPGARVSAKPNTGA